MAQVAAVTAAAGADLAGCGLVLLLWLAAAVVETATATVVVAVVVTTNLAGFGCIELGWGGPVVGWDLNSGSGGGVVSVGWAQG